MATTTKREIRHLLVGDVLPDALSSGPLRVTGVKLRSPPARGGHGTAWSEYEVSAVWVKDGKPIAGLIGFGRATLNVEVT